MILNLTIDSKQVQVQIPDLVLKEGHDFFSKIEADMNKGWRMGPEYIENPNIEQRIQIVADRLLVALESEKIDLTQLLAGYIMTRDPSIKSISIDLNGDPLSTEIIR